MSEISRLRFALAFPNRLEARRALRITVAYRAGEGRPIVEAAAKAVKAATLVKGEWN